jgi:hypothetical protein
MGLDAGDSIPFILTVFSVILSIIPAIELPRTNDSPPTNLALFQATIDAIHDNNSKQQHLFANNLLHKSTNSSNYTHDENIPVSAYYKIIQALDLYNNESPSANNINYTTMLSNLTSYLHDNCKLSTKTNMDICNKILVFLSFIEFGAILSNS